MPSSFWEKAQMLIKKTDYEPWTLHTGQFTKVRWGRSFAYTVHTPAFLRLKAQHGVLGRLSMLPLLMKYGVSLTTRMGDKHTTSLDLMKSLASVVQASFAGTSVIYLEFNSHYLRTNFSSLEGDVDDMMQMTVLYSWGKGSNYTLGHGDLTDVVGWGYFSPPGWSDVIFYSRKDRKKWDHFVWKLLLLFQCLTSIVQLCQVRAVNYYWETPLNIHSQGTGVRGYGDLEVDTAWD